jgi:4-amino-4-deoxy-L-arabinose transferase-like glycosyltransferase
VYWAGLYRIFGHRYSVVRASECLLDVLTILLIYAIAHKCYGRRVALLAAAIYAIWPTALIYTSQLASETPYTFLFCGFILLSLEFAERKTLSWAIAAGFVLGFSLLTRGNAIFMVVLMVPWGLWQFRRLPRAMLRSMAIPAVALLTLVPWTIRNYRVFHAFVPFQSGGGDVLLGSNNRIIANDPSYYGYWIYAVSDLPEYRAQITAPNNEIVRDQVEKHLAVQWLRDHPETWWYFAETRFRRSWTPFLQAKSPRVFRIGMLVSYGPILLLFVFGVFPTLIRALKTNSPAWLLHLGILHFVLTAEVFWGSSRFRYPVEGLIIVVASETLVRLYGYFRSRGPVDSGSRPKEFAEAGSRSFSTNI